MCDTCEFCEVCDFVIPCRVSCCVDVCSNCEEIAKPVREARLDWLFVCASCKSQ